MFNAFLRADPVELLVAPDPDGTKPLNDVADVLLFFQHSPTGTQYALVRYYTVQRGVGANGYLHRKMMVPRIKTRNPRLLTTYGCIEVTQIAGHAHIVPDFESPSDGTASFYFWDLLS